MHEVLVLILCIAVLFGLGAPLALIVDQRRAAALALPLGLAVTAVLATALYVLNMPIGTIRWILAAIASIGGAYAYTHRRNFDWMGRTHVVFGFVGVLSILIAPLVFGGVQFAVFLGNIWDHFNYLTGSVLYANHTYRELLGATQSQVLSNPMIPLARDLLASRPTVFLLFALMLFNTNASFVLLSYVFHAFFMSLTFLAILFLIEVGTCESLADSAGTRRTRLITVLLSAAFPLGFWGQYVVDIDAWSQISSIPHLVVYIGFILALLPGQLTAPSLLDWRKLFGAGLALAAAVVSYPETAAIHMAAIMLGIGAFAVANRLPILQTVRLGSVLMVGLLGALVSFEGVVMFMLGQLKFGAQAKTDWWVYFQRFLLGRDNFVDYVISAVSQMIDVGQKTHRAEAKGLAIQYVVQHWSDAPMLIRCLMAPINVCLGVAGLYFLTIPRTESNVLLFLGLALTFGILLLLFRLVRAAVPAVRQLFGSARFQFLSGFWLAFLAVVVLLAAKGQIWSAGKGLAFMSPYIVIGLALPALLSHRNAARPTWTRCLDGRFLALGYVASSLCFGVVRVIAVGTHSDGTSYALPYPSILHPEDKQRVRWELDVSQLRGCRALKVDVSDPFQRQYVLLHAEYLGKAYYYTFPIKTSYHLDPNFEGLMPPISTDCRVYQRTSREVSSFEVEKDATHS